MNGQTSALPGRTSLLAQQAALYGGLGALPAIQRANYLSQALDNLGQAGANGSIKSGTALGADLLAEALLNFGRVRNDKALLSSIQGGQAAMLRGQPLPGEADYDAGQAGGGLQGGANAGRPADSADLLQNSGISPAPGAPIPPAGNSGLSGPLPAQGGPAPPGGMGSAPAATPANASSPTGGDPSLGAALDLHGQADVSAPPFPAGGFEPIAPNPGSDGGLGAALGAALEAHGQPPAPPQPYGASPDANAAHLQLAMADLADPRVRPGELSGLGGGLPPPPPPPPAGAFATPGAPSAVGGGPSPLPPAAGASGSPPSPAAFGSPTPPSAPGGQGGQITPQPFPVQPAQFQRLNQLKAAAQAQPQLYMQQYLAYRNELAQQASTPEQLEISRPNDVGQITITGKSSGRVYGVQNVPGAMTAAGPKFVMGPDGRPSLVPGTGVQQLPPSAPGVETQQGPDGRVTNEAVPNAVQSGQVWDAQQGRYVPLPGLQPVTTGGFQPGTVVTQKPGESPSVTQGPPYSAQDLINQRNAFKSGDTYRSYVNTASALNSLGTILHQATGNNGIVDMSAFDNLIRAQTGLSARQGNMAMMMEHLGFPAEAAGLVNNIAGNGFTTPDQIRSAYQALRGYATTHGQIAQHELDEETALARRGGQEFGLTLPTLAPPPNVPWMGSSNPGGAGGQGNTFDMLQQARGAIARGAPRAAVIQRLQGMGVNPAGL
jgi:hypothetical protein